MNTTRRLRTARGFTLIELLVVIAIIALLAAILFPVFAKAREKARQTACLSNMNQIAKALEMYKGDYDGFYVPSYVGLPPTFNTQRAWPSLIYSYVQSQDVFICPSAPDTGQGVDPQFFTGATQKYTGITKDVNCSFPSPPNNYIGDSSTNDTWSDGTPTGIVHSLSYAVNLIPDVKNNWKDTTWGNNGTPAQATNLHKSGFADTSTYTGLNEAKLEDPAGTIHIVEAMVSYSTTGSCYPPSSMRGIINWQRTDHNSTAQANKVAYRHSGGFNAIFGDGHVKWRPYGTTKESEWTIQQD